MNNPKYSHFFKMITGTTIIFLAACSSDVEISRTTKKYEIVNINPPKRFYVDIKDVETGQIYKDKYVSKRCSDWKKLKMGSTWEFLEVTYQGNKGTYSKVEGVTELCNLLRKKP